VENSPHKSCGTFDDFLGDYARREKHRTVKTYGALLKQFENWLDGRDIGEFSRDDVLTFMKEKEWTNSSRNTCLSAIKGWAKFEKSRVPIGATLEEIQIGRQVEKKLENIASIKEYPQERKVKRPLTLEQIRWFLDVMAEVETRCLFWLFNWFGWRVGETKLITGIKWGNNSIDIQTEKAGGMRTLYFDDYTERIMKYVIEKGLLNLSSKRIWSMFKRYSTPEIDLTPHICRHTFATRFAELTDRDTVRKMLGHGAEDVTAIYIDPAQQRIKELMLKHHYLMPLEPREDVDA